MLSAEERMMLRRLLREDLDKRRKDLVALTFGALAIAVFWFLLGGGILSLVIAVILTLFGLQFVVTLLVVFCCYVVVYVVMIVYAGLQGRGDEEEEQATYYLDRPVGGSKAGMPSGILGTLFVELPNLTYLALRNLKAFADIRYLRNSVEVVIAILDHFERKQTIQTVRQVLPTLPPLEARRFMDLLHRIEYLRMVKEHDHMVASRSLYVVEMFNQLTAQEA